MIKSRLLAVLLFSASLNLFSQNINWKSLSKEQKHLVNISIGLDYSTTLAFGYGYQLNTKLPIVLNTELSLPFGNKPFDDLKTKLGGQVEVLSIGDFSTTAKVYGVFRRYGSENARFLNFGSEFTAVSGYYKPTWHIAGEFGFDKAIVTNVKHGDRMKEYNPSIKDGWYIPTGGNFFYGIQSSYSFGNNDLNLNVGRNIEQDFKTNNFVPYYLKLGYVRKFK